MNNQDKKQKRNSTIRSPLNAYEKIRKEQRKERALFPFAITIAVITVFAASAIGELIVENTSILQLLNASSPAPASIKAVAKTALQMFLGMLCVIPIMMIAITIWKNRNE